MAQISINDRRTRAGAGSLQPFVGTATLIGVLVSAIALGANRPAAWSALSLWVMGMFVLQIVLDWRDPPDARRSRVLIPALLFAGVLGWGLLQIWPGALAGQADPAWQLVPDAAPRLSLDPVQGAHVLMRLCVYGMVFWIMARTAETAKHAQALLALQSTRPGPDLVERQRTLVGDVERHTAQFLHSLGHGRPIGIVEPLGALEFVQRDVTHR